MNNTSATRRSSNPPSSVSSCGAYIGIVIGAGRGRAAGRLAQPIAHRIGGVVERMHQPGRGGVVSLGEAIEFVVGTADHRRVRTWQPRGAV